MIRAFSRVAKRVCTARGQRRSGCSAGIALLAALAALPAEAAEYPLAPDQNVVGEMRRYTVREGEVFADIARHFDIGYTALVTANTGVEHWLNGVGREITIPEIHIIIDTQHPCAVDSKVLWNVPVCHYN